MGKLPVVSGGGHNYQLPPGSRWRSMEFWDPLVGCSPVSEGCAFCSSARSPAVPKDLTVWHNGHPRFAGVVRWDELKFEDYLFFPKNKEIFVCGRSDLFHEQVPLEQSKRVVDAARERPDCTFFALTKRPHRMQELLSSIDVPTNFWAGITVESERRVDRLRFFEGVKATKIVSAKPLLSDINFLPWKNYFDAIVVGGEYNYIDLNRSRPMHISWARSIRDQCREMGKPFSFHNWGSWIPCDHSESMTVIDGQPMKHHDHSDAAYLLDGEIWDQYP